jgi:hypothetical protein
VCPYAKVEAALFQTCRKSEFSAAREGMPCTGKRFFSELFSYGKKLDFEKSLSGTY